ncbi:MAG: sulfurtransferase TusA family protein [Burkholderiales bacterium]|nr:sulfurtransferase TusA family protein [Burkholderiales bacterium]
MTHATGQRTTTKHDVALDLSGLACPAPLLGAKQVMDDLAPGQVLMLVSDCPGTFDDLSAWVKYTDHELVGHEKVEGKRVAFYLRKGRSAPPAANAVLDIRGVSCPGPIVEAKKLLDGMRPGEILRLVSSCPGSPADVRAWVRTTALELVEVREPQPSTYEFFVRKK